MEKDLKEEVKQLNKRINDLEDMIRQLMKPFQDIRNSTENYFRITRLLLEHGGLTPDLILPELKDNICQEIVRVLLERKDQNISQITELVRNKRGTASRRIIRQRLNELEKKEIIQKHQKGKLYVYSLTENVLRKWSQMLGFNI